MFQKSKPEIKPVTMEYAMKILTISALCFLSLLDVCFTAPSEYSWNKIPFPSAVIDSSTFYCIHAFNRNEAIAAGSNGTITYVNADDGVYSQKHYGNQTFQWICFADSLFGWAVGDSGTIYATSDRGGTWIQQSSGVKIRLNAVVSVDANNVWVAGDSGIILHTSDGGKNWNHQSILSEFSHDNRNDCFDLISIAFRDNAVGCIGGNWRTSNESVLLMTCDSGNRWTSLNFLELNVRGLYEVAFRNEIPIAFIDNIYVPADSTVKHFKSNVPCVTKFGVCENSLFSFRHCNYTHNCSYHKINNHSDKPSYYVNYEFPGITNETMYAIDSVNSQTAWIAGTRGSIFRTTDMGLNWISMNNGKNQSDDLEFIDFFDNQHGFIGGKNGTLLSSDDGGKTWKYAILPVNASLLLSDMIFTDVLHGFLVEQLKTVDNSFLLQKTIDGGKTWTMEAKYPKGVENLRQVDKNNLIGFGNYLNEIYFSSNGGVDWQTQPNEDYYMCNDLYPVTRDTFFIISKNNNMRTNGGIILKSTDHGVTLDMVSSIDHADALHKNFNSITFSNPATGWVVGDSGLILKSIDSGYTWKRQPSPTTDTLTKIRFYNPYFGWTFGNSKIFLTSDGGATWQDKSILTSTKVGDVICSDPENCWAVGDDGLILHLSNRSNKFFEITYPDKSTVLAVNDSFTVRWKIAGKSQVSIAISYDLGQNYTVYRAATDDDGEETVRISANATASTTCKVRIQDLEQTMQGESECFTIVSSTVSVNNRITLPLETGCHISGSSITYTLAKDAPVSVKIYTFSGRQVCYQSSSVKSKGISVEQLPLKQLPGGCYLLRVSIGGCQFTRNLFVHR